MKEKIIIIGTGGHGRVVAEAALISGLTLLGFIDVNYSGKEEIILNYPVLGGLNYLKKNEKADISLIVAIGDNEQRHHIFTECLEQGHRFATVLHPSAYISPSAIIHEGCFIGAGAIIQTLVIIHENTIINSGAIVEHSSIIKQSCHIAPGAKVAGSVTVGMCAFLGAGSTLIQNLVIGKNVVVGAGSVILKDIATGQKIVGNPGRLIE